MAVLIASGKSLKLEKTSDHVYDKDAYASNELATMSAGLANIEKGFLLKDWTAPFDEVAYMLKGSVKIEDEGKTYVAHEGDFVHTTKGSKITLSTDEGYEIFFVTSPHMRKAGAAGGI